MMRAPGCASALSSVCSKRHADPGPAARPQPGPRAGRCRPLDRRWPADRYRRICRAAKPSAARPRTSIGRPLERTGRLLVSGIALSIDNLAVGFALGAYHVNLAADAVLIGVVSVTLSLVGLELGNRLGNKTGERGELIGGLVLIAVGMAIASGVL